MYMIYHLYDNFPLYYRACLGMHFAKATLFAIVASMVAIYELKRARDGRGKEIDVFLESTWGLSTYVKTLFTFTFF